MEENKYIISDKEKCLEYLKNTDGAFIKLDHISENLKYDPDIMKNILMKNQTLINDFSDKIMDMDYSKVLDDLFDTYGAELLTRISPELKENPNAYQYIEVMSCAGGCIGGGGMPLLPVRPADQTALIEARRKVLYGLDSEKTGERTAHSNPVVKEYMDWVKAQNDPHLEHEVYHTSF